MADTRSYSNVSKFLTINGTRAPLSFVEGGDIYADVIKESAPFPFVGKHIGNAKFASYKLEAGLLNDGLNDFITRCWDGRQLLTDGTITTADFNFKEEQIEDFRDAVLTATTIPACDGSSKDAAHLTLELQPSSIRVIKGSGADTRGSAGPKVKTVLCSNFRFELGDLPCARVSNIEAFTVKATAGDSTGRGTALDFPNLFVTISTADKEEWMNWHQDFVINGNNGQDKELSGALTFLAPNLKDKLLRISFFQVGIFSLHVNAFSAHSEKISRFTVGLYCEQMKFND